jgi:hypothetical protein
MSNKRPRIPEATAKTLRQEVKFGCPVPGCSNFILECHHFDPPWNEGQVHRAEGMILLCQDHHKMAHGGLYSDDELRSFKAEAAKSARPPYRLQWDRPGVLVVVGAELFVGSVYLSRELGIGIGRDSDNRLQLNLKVSDDQGNLVASVENNWLTVHDPYDIKCSSGATSFKIWSEKGQVGLEMRIERSNVADVVRACTVNPPWLENVPEDELDLDGGIAADIDSTLRQCAGSDGQVLVIYVDRVAYFKHDDAGVRRIEIKNKCVSGGGICWHGGMVVNQGDVGLSLF